MGIRYGFNYNCVKASYKYLYLLGTPFDLFASEATLVGALGFLRHASICKAYGTGLHSQ